MSISTNIKSIREKLNLTPQELAEKVRVSVETVELWENGTLTPTLENLLCFKKFLNVSIDDILSDTVVTSNAKNPNSLDTICGALAYAMGIDAPKQSADKNPELSSFIDKAFNGEKIDRLVMYNPDAIAEWLYKKYPHFFDDVKKYSDIEIPLASVMPSVTPVCFGTMYTGAQPEVHGIQGYVKPVIKIDTLFDALIRAGKKVALVTYGSCSLSKIYLEREIDYFHFEKDDIIEVNAKAMELILSDKHDVIVIYNGNYDHVMHRLAPESKESLAELRLNCHVYAIINELIKNNWKNHNTLVGFAMDHGCHEIDGNSGSHGLDMIEDINIVHHYKAYKKQS